MKFLLGFFSDKGDLSMIRLLSLICVLTASGIAVHAVTRGSDLNAAAVLCGVFLASGIGGKVAQTITEGKNG